MCPFYLYPVLSSVLLSYKKSSKNIDGLELPSLIAEITYSDISGNHYSVKKDIAFELALSGGFNDKNSDTSKDWWCKIVYKIE